MRTALANVTKNIRRHRTPGQRGFATVRVVPGTRYQVPGTGYHPRCPENPLPKIPGIQGYLGTWTSEEHRIFCSAWIIESYPYRAGAAHKPAFEICHDVLPIHSTAHQQTGASPTRCPPPQDTIRHHYTAVLKRAPLPY